MNHNLRSILSGQGVSLITPFNEAGEIDYPRLEGLVLRLVHDDSDFIIALGTSSECSLLSIEEQVRVLDFVSEINESRKPLIAGIAGADTRSSVQRAASFDRRDIAAIFCASSNPSASSQSGYIGHCRSVSVASPLPVILHNAHQFKTAGMTCDTIMELAHEPNIVGVIECSGDVALTGELIRSRPDHFAILSGRDVMALPLLSLGVDGVVSSIGNAFSKEFGSMVHQLLFGSIHEARKTHHALAPLMRILETEGDPTCIKTILAHLNLCDARVRLPNTPVSNTTKQAIYDAIAELPLEMLRLETNYS